jgi:hypothetical protein
VWILPKNKINYSAQKRKQQSHLRYLKFGSLVNSRLTSNYQLQRRLSKEHPSHVWFYIVQLYGFRRLKLKITSSQNGRPSWFSPTRLTPQMFGVDFCCCYCCFVYLLSVSHVQCCTCLWIVPSVFSNVYSTSDFLSEFVYWRIWENQDGRPFWEDVIFNFNLLKPYNWTI